jgi:hypothetical protein
MYFNLRVVITDRNYLVENADVNIAVTKSATGHNSEPV